MIKKREIEKKYYTVCYLTDKIQYKTESSINKTEPYAIKHETYEKALSALLKHKLNYFLKNSQQKTVRQKLMSLEEIINTIRTYLNEK